MKFYTGDENGLVKVITVPPLRKKLKVTQPTVELWGKVDKTQSIQHLHLSELEGQKVIAAARINGRVTFHSRDDGSMVKELLLYESSRANFVGLHADKDRCVTCNDSGSMIITKHDANTTHSISLPSDLCRLQVHPTMTNIFAFGGKERDLEIHDISLHLSDSSVDATSANSNGSHPHIKKKATSPAQLFAAKNVKNDFLDLRVPVHITDLQFLEPYGSWEKVVTGTRHHQIRIYDAKSGRRRPVQDWEFGQDPIVSVTIGGERDPHSIYVSNTTATLAAIDIRTGKVIRHYRGGIPKMSEEPTDEPKPALKKRGLTEGGGPTGAVLASTILGGDNRGPANSGILLGAVGLDRYLRVYKATDVVENGDATKSSAIAKATSKDGQLLQRIYLKSRLSAICSEWDEADLETDESDEEAEPDEELWTAMQPVDDDDDDDDQDVQDNVKSKMIKKRKT